VVLLTEWNEFRGLDLAKLARKMAVPQMADLRNIYDPDEVREAGFTAYVGVGR
jgi:UDPglucose 6-dehydrogenase